jgi:preprotein translocase subunit SecG
MVLLASVDWLHYLFMIPLALLSVFLVLVILVQRGRGGGLTGALGGMGGQSAFGTKAGDLFTRITIVVAAIWVLLSMASLKVLSSRSETAGLNPNARRNVPTAPLVPGGAGAAVPPATGDSKLIPPGSEAPPTSAPATGDASTPAATPPASAPAPAAPAAESGAKPTAPDQP